VDIPSAHSNKFFLPARPLPKPSRSAPLAARSLKFFLTCVPLRKSAANIFLNCTKNTELTSHHFTRTVTFTLTTKKEKQPRSQTGWRAMKAMQWKTYRTRFLVKAKQLSSTLNFTDSLGRQHSGRKGDYLVESSDGVLRIAPRQIFEDVYVPLALIDEERIISLDEGTHQSTHQRRATPMWKQPPSLALSGVEGAIRPGTARQDWRRSG
jgi:hypothetical protein